MGSNCWLMPIVHRAETIKSMMYTKTKSARSRASDPPCQTRIALSSTEATKKEANHRPGLNKSICGWGR